MPIDATEPTVLDAAYDKWAIAEFQVSGDGLTSFGSDETRRVKVYVRMVKYRVREDGIPERSPIQADQRSFEISDLYAEAAKDPALADVLQRLTVAVATHAYGMEIL